MGWGRLTSDYVVLVNREVEAAKEARAAASAWGDNLIEAERQLVRVDWDRNAGGLVGETNQVVEAKVQVEYGLGSLRKRDSPSSLGEMYKVLDTI